MHIYNDEEYIFLTLKNKTSRSAFSLYCCLILKRFPLNDATFSLQDITPLNKKTSCPYIYIYIKLTNVSIDPMNSLRQDASFLQNTAKAPGG